MINEMECPEDWENIKLEELVKLLRNGINLKQKNKGKYIITRIETISNETIDLTRVKYVDDLSDKLVNTYRLIKGDILFSHINSTKHLGKTAICKDDSKNIIHGINLLLFRPNDRIHPEYLLLQLKKLKQNHLFERIAKKAVNQASISTRQLKKIHILVPPMFEQQKIASILSKVDEQIQLTETIINKTEELKKGLTQQLLTKGIRHTKFKRTELGEIPEEWEIKKLENIAKVIDSLHKTPEYSQEGYPMVRVTDIKGGYLKLDETVKVSEKNYIDFTKNHEPQKGDIIITRVGSFGVVNFVAIDNKFCLGQNTAIISSVNVENKYLFYFLESKLVQNFIRRQVYGSSQSSLTLKCIRNLSILIPNKDEQNKIALILSIVDKQIQDNNKELNHLHELKKGLMKDLLTGKVRVNV